MNHGKLIESRKVITEAAIWGVLWKKGVLKIFAKFAEKYLYQSSFLIKFQAEPCNVIKEALA